MLSQHSGLITVTTRGPGLTDITVEAKKFVGQTKIECGLLNLFLRHTSASLMIQENADADVLRDLEDFFSRLVSRDLSLYRHRTEGPDDMPAAYPLCLDPKLVDNPGKGQRARYGHLASNLSI
jgi:secondary thiamine-phosphate synthase enzyme